MSRVAALGAGLVAIAALTLGIYTLKNPSSTPSSRPVSKKAPKLDDRPYELRFKLPDMVLREPPPEFMSEELSLRESIEKLPEDAPEATELKSALAALLIESGYGSRPPEADTLAEGRALAEQVMRQVGDGGVTGRKLRTLLLLAEGKVEDAQATAHELQQAADGRKYVDEKCCKWERVGTAATDDEEIIWDAYHMLAQTHLAAACGMACAARKHELLAKHAVAGAVFEKDPHKEASTQRAGAMWRVMEAGRVYERAYKAAPSANATWNALDCHFATRRLRTLNAFQVSTTEKLFELANCEQYVGARVNGKTCLAEDDNPYDKAREKRRKKKKKR